MISMLKRIDTFLCDNAYVVSALTYLAALAFGMWLF